MGRDFQIHCFALDQLDRCLTQKPRDDEFFDLWWSRDNGGKGCCRIGADGHRYFESAVFALGRQGRGRFQGPGCSSCRLRHHPYPSGPWISGSVCDGRPPQALTQVLRGYLLPLPVHARGLPVIDLHAIHAYIAFAGFRVTSGHAGEGNESAAVKRPALEHGKVQDAEVFSQDYLLAGRVFGGNECEGKSGPPRPRWAASSIFPAGLPGV